MATPDYRVVLGGDSRQYNKSLGDAQRTLARVHQASKKELTGISREFKKHIGSAQRDVVGLNQKLSTGKARLAGYASSASMLGGPFRLLSGGAIAATAAIALLTLGLAKAASESGKFQTAMSEVATLLPGQAQTIKELTSSVSALAITFGSSEVAQAKAIYQIISAGATSAAAASDSLTVSNKLSIAGVTDLTTAADGLTTVMNAYGTRVGSAIDVSDALFTAMRLGKTTIGELSRSLGRVVPISAASGVSFDELLASIVALTKQGVSTKESMTGVRAIIAAILKPTEEAKKESKLLSIEFNAEALAAKGLVGFLEEVQRATQGNIASMAQLFGGVEALVPLTALLGEGWDDVADALNNLENKQDATDIAMKEFGDNYEFQMKRAGVATDALFKMIGDNLTPAMTELARIWADWVGDIATDELTKQERKLKSIKEQIDGLLALRGESGDPKDIAAALRFEVFEGPLRKLRNEYKALADDITKVKDSSGNTAKQLASDAALQADTIKKTADRQRVLDEQRQKAAERQAAKDALLAKNRAAEGKSIDDIAESFKSATTGLSVWTAAKEKANQKKIDAAALTETKRIERETAARDLNIAGLNNEIEALNKMIESRRSGEGAYELVRERAEAEAEATRLGVKANDENRESVIAMLIEKNRLIAVSGALGEAHKAEAVAVDDLSESYMAGVEALRERNRERDKKGETATRRVDDVIKELENEAKWIGKNNKEKALGEAIRAAESKLLDDMGNKIRELSELEKQRIGTAIETMDNFKQQKELWDDVGTAIESSLNRVQGAITDMFVQGKGDAIKWRNVVIASLVEIATSMARVAAIKMFGSSGGNQSIGGLIGSFLVSAIGGALGGGPASATAGQTSPVTGLGKMHGGGTVGLTASPRRSVSAAAIASAPRFHDGSIRSDELLAVLEKGEIVLTEKQQKDAMRRGTNSGEMTVNIHNYAGVEIQTSIDSDQKQMDIFLRAARTMVANDIEEGGQVRRAMERRLGSDPSRGNR